MNKTVSGEENLYFEMESVKKETEARIYGEVPGESVTNATEQTSNEKSAQRAEKKQNASAEHKHVCHECDATALRRMFIVMSVVAAVALLTAIAAMILALTEMKSRNHATAEVQGIGSTCAMGTGDDDRSQRMLENMTTLNKKLLNLTTTLLQTSDAALFALVVDINSTITKKVNDVSKMTGPVGPPGHNGSQGSAGPAGASGPPGPKGAGDFSSCQYKVKTQAMTPEGKTFLGVTCSTNFAAEYNFKSQQQPSGKWIHVCTCKGSSTLFTPRRGETKNCYLHYWECPLTT
ncbi:hypothetical protein ACROYT_G040831 [Oculina patagonica]